MIEDVPETSTVVPEVKPVISPPIVTGKVTKNLFVFNSENPRVYVDRGLIANHGDIVEWNDGAPDVCWDAVNDSKEN